MKIWVIYKLLVALTSSGSRWLSVLLRARNVRSLRTGTRTGECIASCWNLRRQTHTATGQSERKRKELATAQSERNQPGRLYRERKTDRQTETQRDRGRDREADRQTETHRETERCRESEVGEKNSGL